MSEPFKVDWAGVPDTFEHDGQTYKSVRVGTACCDGCAFNEKALGNACFGEGFPPCVDSSRSELKRYIFKKVD